MVLSLFSGAPRRGDHVTLTIDSSLCTEIGAAFRRHSATRGKRGAAVVMNYRTGELLAMASLPTFDPEHITADTLSDVGKPFWNRAVQSLYPPGSTFKIVTAASALQNSRTLGDVTQEDFLCTGGLLVSGHVIHDYADAVHGHQDLRAAFSHSCNGVFAQLALRLGDKALRNTAAAFGFGDNFLFRDLVVENSLYPAAGQSDLEQAACGFGQSAIAASPLHMCMVAAAIANDGVMMEPQLLYRAGSLPAAAFASRPYRTPVTADQAALLRSYMRTTVLSGTGTRAAVSGLPICGKTGTAESSLNGLHINYGWFVGFIDDPDLPYAVSVLVEDVPDGQGGGVTAAPIAADLFTYLRDLSTVNTPWTPVKKQ